jgi:hypothetical protein
MDKYKALLTVLGQSYSRLVYAKRCPICYSGPKYEAKYFEFHSTLLKYKLLQPTEREAFDKEYDFTSRKYAEFRLHKDQRAVCRKATQELDSNLKAGEGWVVRDFVNHFDGAGKHVKCLHWVLRYRDKDEEPIKMVKMRNWCSDKRTCSPGLHYVQEADQFHLTNKSKQEALYKKNFSGATDKLHTITFTSDHGSHFVSKVLYRKMCTYYRLYPGKEFRMLLYEAYHGEGRADGAGAQDKVLAWSLLRSGRLLFGAEAFSRMTNQNNDAMSIGYEFKCINLSEGILPKEKTVVGYTHLAKWCEIKFDYPKRCEDTEGIVLYRFVPGKGQRLSFLCTLLLLCCGTLIYICFC